jgi:hypothetical protein
MVAIVGGDDGGDRYVVVRSDGARDEEHARVRELLGEEPVRQTVEVIVIACDKCTPLLATAA